MSWFGRDSGTRTGATWTRTEREHRPTGSGKNSTQQERANARGDQHSDRHTRPRGDGGRR